MSDDPRRPAAPSPACADDPAATRTTDPTVVRSRERATPDARPRPARPPASGLFHKREDAIGQAPVFFSVALGIAFGSSIGLLLGQPIIGIVFGGLLGLLYGAIRHTGRPGR